MAEHVCCRAAWPIARFNMALGDYGDPFHDVVKNHGSARSCLSFLKQVLKVPFTAIPLFCTKQEAMGTNVKMRQWWEVGIIQAPISLLHCREEDVASSHGADCYAHYLHGIMGPSAICSNDSRPIVSG